MKLVVSLCQRFELVMKVNYHEKYSTVHFATPIIGAHTPVDGKHECEASIASSNLQAEYQSSV